MQGFEECGLIITDHELNSMASTGTSSESKYFRRNANKVQGFCFHATILTWLFFEG